MAKRALETLREKREDLNAQHAMEQDYDDPNEENTLEELIDADRKIDEYEERIRLVDA